MKLGPGQLYSEAIVGIFQYRQGFIEAADSFMQSPFDCETARAGMRQIRRIPGLLHPILLRICLTCLDPGVIQLLSIKTAGDEIVPGKSLAYGGQPPRCHDVVRVAESDRLSSGYLCPLVARVSGAPAARCIDNAQ